MLIWVSVISLWAYIAPLPSDQLPINVLFKTSVVPLLCVKMAPPASPRLPTKLLLLMSVVPETDEWIAPP